MLHSETQPTTAPTFRQRHGAKAIALFFWLAVVGGYYWYTRRNGLTFGDSITQVAELMAGSLYGPLIFIVLYTIRPLIFFPATIITLLGGFLFGPLGILYTIVGSNASALVAYGAGSYLGRGVLDDPDNAGLIQRYTRRMRDNSFETVLIMRLLFLPYDLVNYAAGFLKIDWKAFLAATAIGSVPGTISFVLLGASFGTLAELLTGDVQLRPGTVIASVLLIGVSIALSRAVKKREARLDSAESTPSP